VASGGEAVSEACGDVEVAVLSISRCDAVLQHSCCVADAILGTAVVHDVRRREHIEFKTFADDDATATIVAIANRLCAGGRVLMGNGEASVLNQSGIGTDQGGDQGRLKCGHGAVVRGESLSERLLSRESRCGNQDGRDESQCRIEPERFHFPRLL